MNGNGKSPQSDENGDQSCGSGSGEQRVSRRHVLALLATTMAGSAAAWSAEPNSDESTPPPVRQGEVIHGRPGGEQIPPETEPEESGRSPQNIEYYGGVEGEDTVEAIRRNVLAIDTASRVAQNNTVYIPEGKWYVGDPNIGKFLNAGVSGDNRGAQGLGFVGDGPEKSFLITSSTIPAENGNMAIRYSGQTTHQNVTWKDLTYDGNGNLDLPKSRSQWGIHINGPGDYTFENVRFRNFHSNCILGTGSGGYSINIDYCTFQRNGIGRHNNTRGNSVGHHLAVAIDKDRRLSVKNSVFEVVSGTCLDLSSGSAGEISVENCWASGAGDGFIKVHNADVIDISNLYFKGESEQLTDALNTEPGFLEHHGRYFFYRLSGDLSTTPTFKLNDIKSVDTPYHAIQVRRGFKIAVTGGDEGPIVFQNVAGRGPFTGAIRDDADQESKFQFDVDELSVHDTTGQVFRSPSSEGTIKTLKRSRNDGLGDPGEITIEVDNIGAEPFDPDTPSRDEVGINELSNGRNP